MHNKTRILIYVLFLFATANTFLPWMSPRIQAQTAQDLLELSAEDYFALKIPPLDTLLKNAQNSGTMEYYTHRVDEEKRELKSSKRVWLQYFRINANYQYGTVYGNTIPMGESNLPYYNPYSGKASSFWNVGASIALPLSEIFNGRNRVKKQEAIVHQAENESQRYLDEQSLKIIAAYTEALKSIALLKIKSEAAALSSAQYKLSEGKFVNGQIDATELSRQKNMESSSFQDYEEIKSNLNNSLLQLEILSHTLIISNK